MIDQNPLFGRWRARLRRAGIAACALPVSRLSRSFALQSHYPAWLAEWRARLRRAGIAACASPISRLSRSFALQFRKQPAWGATGFTLLEVLIALGITALLTFAVGSSLILVLRSEQTARQMQGIGLILQSVMTAEHAGMDVAHEAARWEPDWFVASDIREYEFGEPPTAITWRVWSIAPRERPSLRVETAFRVREQAEE